jgi:hypothetical protein
VQSVAIELEEKKGLPAKRLLDFCAMKLSSIIVVSLFLAATGKSHSVNSFQTNELIIRFLSSFTTGRQFIG